MVKEAASLKKNNLFGDSTDLHCVSQSSLTDSRTPPLSAPSSPPVVLASVPLAQQAEHKPTSALRETIVEEAGQKSVIPSVTITVSSPESEEPTATSSVVETVQPDVLPEISSSPVTKTPDISLTEAVSTTSDVPTKPASVDLSSSEPQEPLSDKQGSSAISSSSSESSDQSVCLTSTGAGSPVPPALESENIEVPLCASVLADEESKDTSSTQSEIEEACIHHVQPGVTMEINAEVLPDLDHIVTPGNTSTCNEKTVANIDCDVVPSSEERNEKVEEDIPQISVTCDSVPDVPVEDAVALTSELNHSSTAVCTDASEAEETADSVKAIKDLIMEVIEVEDEVRPWV